MPRSTDYKCSNRDKSNLYIRCSDPSPSTLRISKDYKFSGAQLICDNCIRTKDWYIAEDYEFITKNDYLLLPKPEGMDTEAKEQVVFLCLLVV